MALSLVLLVGAGLLFRSLMTLIDMPLGFTSGRILTLQMAPTGENYRSTGQLIAYWSNVLERVQAVPGVESAALTTSLPMSGGRSLIAFNVEGRPQAPLSQQPLAFRVEVSPGDFRTLGIPVSARAPQNLVVRTAGDPMAVAAATKAAVQAIDASLPLSPPRPLGAVIGASLTQRRFNMTLLAAFAGIALLLAMAGIYGTVSCAVAQRNNEIGIRVALGAAKGEILRLVLRDALRPVAGGLVVGLMAAFGLTRALERLVFGVSTTDAVRFVSLPVLLALVAFIASLVPALRATKVDPLDALRMD